MRERYIRVLQEAIRQKHGCASSHLESVTVKETFNGETVWEGNVEIFKVEGHSRALHCFAWASPMPNGKEWTYVAILKSPVVPTPLRAVQAFIMNRHG